MKAVFPWYVYAFLGLLLVAAGISSITQETLFPGAFYALGGLLLFGAAIVIGRQRKNDVAKKMDDVMLIIKPELKTLIKAGKQVEAVRRYRLYKSCDLQEAKAYVDGIALEIEAEEKQ